MASSKQDLEALHKLITKSYTNRISQDLEDNIPTDAATLSGAAKFLKDNDVTVDPSDSDDLADLRKGLTELAEKRRQRAGSIVSLVKQDLEQKEA